MHMHVPGQTYQYKKKTQHTKPTTTRSLLLLPLWLIRMKLC